MRLDNTASSVTLHPLCLEVTFHYYQVTSPHRFSAKTKLCFPPSKSVRKCIALPRTLNSACPGSVTLHPKKCNKAKQNRVFASVTLSGTTVPHEAQRRRKGVDFHGKGEPRFRATRREKRGKQQRSVSGFPLKQVKNQKAEKARSFSRPFPFDFLLNHIK